MPTKTAQIIHNVPAYHPALCDEAWEVVTNYDPPPIPGWQQFAWYAWDSDTYEPGQPIGRGPTEAAAIADLHEQIKQEICAYCDQDPPCLPGRCRQGNV